jgi:hypothetical protein
MCVRIRLITHYPTEKYVGRAINSKHCRESHEEKDSNGSFGRLEEP